MKRLPTNVEMSGFCSLRDKFFIGRNSDTAGTSMYSYCEGYSMSHEWCLQSVFQAFNEYSVLLEI